MAVKYTQVFTTTGSQFANLSEFHNFLQISSNCQAEELLIFEKYRSSQQLLAKSTEFDGNKVTVIKYMDSPESLNSMQEELSRLFQNYNVNFSNTISQNNWQYNFDIDQNATVPA